MYRYATTSAMSTAGHGHPPMRLNSFAEKYFTTPNSFSASDIMMSGANQISASQAFRSASSSSQVKTRNTRSAERPASATNVLGNPYHGKPCSDEVTQPAITPSITTISHVSSRISGPRRSSSARANSRAGAMSVISGLKNLNRIQGTTSSESKPGTAEPENQRIQVSSTWPIL